MCPYTDSKNMIIHFAKANKTHVSKLLDWFPDKKRLSSWSGPNFRYPFTEQSFLEDIELDKLASHVLLGNQSNLLAFGQYYNRLDCCHLGRLVVNPEYRNQGMGQQLMNALIAKGTRELNLNKASLFVLSDNHQALSAYKKYGFEIKEYPETIPLKNCLYMQKVVAIKKV